MYLVIRGEVHIKQELVNQFNYQKEEVTTSIYIEGSSFGEYAIVVKQNTDNDPQSNQILLSKLSDIRSKTKGSESEMESRVDLEDSKLKGFMREDQKFRVQKAVVSKEDTIVLTLPVKYYHETVLAVVQKKL